MRATERLELRLTPEMLSQIDGVRGKLGRGTFVKQALEQALGDSSTVEPLGSREASSRVGGSTPPRPAPVRASAELREPVPPKVAQATREAVQGQPLLKPLPEGSVVERNRAKAEGSRPALNKDGRVVPSYDDGGEYKPIPKIAPRR